MKSCEKCGYSEKDLRKNLCSVCIKFAPKDSEKLKEYTSEKIDWKILDTFRKHLSQSQNEGMKKLASRGVHISRPPKGYGLNNQTLVQNEEASLIHTLFKQFSESNISLNQLSKQHNLSVNGLKKILSNRTYLGEIKFNGKTHKSNHEPIISQELFYKVQRILKENSKST